jgi:hypothetical protein
MKESRYISLTGGLGNQLFQYAAALYQSDTRAVSLVSSLGFPRKSKAGRAEIFSFAITEPEISGNAGWLIKKVAGYLLRQGIYRKKLENFEIFRVLTLFVGKIVLSLYFWKKLSLIIGKGVGFHELIQSKGNQLLIGYFQTFYWASDPQVLKQLHQIKLKDDSPKVLDYRGLANVEKPLVVHIRLGDYKNEGDFGILPETYYSSAIQDQLKSEKFGAIWLFSDELEAAQQMLPKELSIRVRLVQEIDESAAATLQVMRFGHGYVIANSTFSWWGAFLSLNSDAKVIAPSPWFRNLPEPAQLIPPHWTRWDAGWS